MDLILTSLPCASPGGERSEPLVASWAQDERGTAEKYASKKRKLVAVTDECEHMRLD